MEPKTDIIVKLTGVDGNAFAVMNKVIKALRQGGHRELIQEFLKEAVSGDYDHLLQTCSRYVIIE